MSDDHTPVSAPGADGDLREQVAAVLYRHRPLPRDVDALDDEAADFYAELVSRIVVAPLRAEVERLTAERDALQSDANIRYGALAGVLGLSRDENHARGYYAAVDHVAGLRIEAERLRAELAAARAGSTRIPDGAGVLLHDSLTALEQVGCQFDHCPGPDVAPVDMMTCYVCELIRRLRAATPTTEPAPAVDEERLAVDQWRAELTAGPVEYLADVQAERGITPPAGQAPARLVDDLAGLAAREDAARTPADSTTPKRGTDR